VNCAGRRRGSIWEADLGASGKRVTGDKDTRWDVAGVGHGWGMCGSIGIGWTTQCLGVAACLYQEHGMSSRRRGGTWVCRDCCGNHLRPTLGHCGMLLPGMLHKAGEPKSAVCAERASHDWMADVIECEDVFTLMSRGRKGAAWGGQGAPGLTSMATAHTATPLCMTCC
jgi:hypothetical protein